MAGINFIENEQYLPKLKFRNNMKVDLDDEKAAIALEKKEQIFNDFIEELKWLRGLYKNQKYTQAERERDRLAEKLDDIMRLG